VLPGWVGGRDPPDWPKLGRDPAACPVLGRADPSVFGRLPEGRCALPVEVRDCGRGEDPPLELLIEELRSPLVERFVEEVRPPLLERFVEEVRPPLLERFVEEVRPLLLE
jgi:hypothetical protein